MPRDRSGPAISRIRVNIMASAVTLITAARDQSAKKLALLQSEIANSSFSVGTNTFSAAS